MTIHNTPNHNREDNTGASDDFSLDDFDLSMNFEDTDSTQKNNNALAKNENNVESVTPHNNGTGGFTAKKAPAPKRSSLFDRNRIAKKEENANYKKEYDFKSYIDGEDGLTKEIIERQRKLRQENPDSQLRAARVLNLEILMGAPKGYFNKYSNDVKRGVDYCRRQIADNDLAEVISKANDNPTDEKIQNDAYLAISRYIVEFIKSTEHRDAHQAIVSNLIVNEILGFDLLDPLWHSPSVTEIVCNGPFDVQVEIGGEMQRVESIAFRNADHLLMLLERLFRSVGKTLAQSTPQTKGRLHDKSRIFATHPSISPDGPNFNIRRHPKGFWTPEALIERNAADEEVMTYLGNLIHKGASFIIAGGTSTGKATLHSELIQTPNGKITMGDISPGDKVFDHTGSIYTVTDKFTNPERQVYAVKFSTGNVIHVDAEHNWLVSTYQSRKSHIYRTREREKNGGYQRKTKIAPEKIANILSLIDSKDYTEFANVGQLEKMVGFAISQKPSLMKKIKVATDTPEKRKKLYRTEKALEIILAHSQETLNDQRDKQVDLWQVKTTQEMLDEGVYLRTSKASDRYNFRVPKLEKFVEFENAKDVDELPIHPYLLGLWLGDGDSNGNGFTSLCEDVNFYESVIPGSFEWYGRNNTCHKIITPGFKDKLKELNILQTESGASKKRVPNDYLYASEAARRELVAGLIDSDGSYLCKTAGWEFYNTNKQLVDDFIQIVSSLGYKANISDEMYKTYTHNGENKQTTNASWVVSVITEDSLAKLPRKVAKHKEIAELSPLSDDDVNNVSIVSIEAVEGRVEEMSCISVDSPHSTYMVSEHFTTTHNTSMLNALTGFYPENARILTLEDNLEMKPNPKKYLAAALETRPPAPDKLNDKGITMRDLVWGAMQMRPEVLIIGEVTDAAAYDLCQALNTGHAGASTFHANSSQLAITRVASLVAQSGLTTIEGAFDLISAAFDFVINLRHFPQDGSRKIFSIDEVGTEVEMRDGKPHLKTTQLWKFDSKGVIDNKVIGGWKQVGDISSTRAERRMFDSQETLNWEQLKQLSSLPEGLGTA